MSFSRWQKLMATRMPKAVPPAVLTVLTAGAWADSFKRAAPERTRAVGAQPDCAGIGPRSPSPFGGPAGRGSVSSEGDGVRGTLPSVRPEGVAHQTGAPPPAKRRAAPARCSPAGSKPLRELQTDQSGLRDAVVHGNWTTHVLDALGIPELAAPTVEHVLDEQLERVGIATQAEGEVGDSICRLLPELGPLGGEQVGPDCALVCEVALHVCLHPREWERIARSHGAFPLRRRRQLLTLRRQRRIR